MKISVSALTTNRKWHLATELNRLLFEKLWEECKKMYREISKQTFGEYLPRETGNNGVLIYPQEKKIPKCLPIPLNEISLIMAYLPSLFSLQLFDFFDSIQTVFHPFYIGTFSFHLY